MGLVKISELPSADGLAGDELYPLVQAGTTKRGTGSTVTNVSQFTAQLAATILVGGGNIYVSGTVALGATQVTIPDQVNIICIGKGKFTSSTTGAALTFDTQTSGHSRIRISRTVRDWGSGTDTTSVGIRIKNCSWTTYDIAECFSFETGLEVRGEAAAVDAGTAYCTFNIGRITNNKRNIRFSGVTTGAGIGFANGNSFSGGAVRHDGGLSGSYAGTVGIDMSTAGNGNTFTGVNLEGSATLKTLYVAQPFNTFVNCRLESITLIHFTSTSYGNLVLGGYGNFGPGTTGFQDDSSQNQFIGARGGNFYSDSSSGSPYNGGKAGLEGIPLNSNADSIYRTRNLAGQITSEILAGGQFRHRTGGEAFPRVATTVTGGNGYGGVQLGRGNIEPDAILGRTTTSQPGIKANCPIVPNVTTVSTSGSPVTVDPALGENYRINITGGFNVAFGTGVDDGQWLEVEFKQDSSGGHAVGFGLATNVLWMGAAAPTITTTANRLSSIRLSWRSDLSKWIETRRSLDIG